MAWELPSSITRALDRLAISRVQRLEGDDSIVPTVQLLSLDQPPFRKTGYRFFGAGDISADATGGAVILSTSSNRCTVVVDSILVSVSGGGAAVTVTMQEGFTAGGLSVYVPENSLTRPLPVADARITARLGAFGGQTIWLFALLADTQRLVEKETVLLVPPPSLIAGDVSIAVNVTVAVVLRVSFSGRIWYSEE